MSIVEFQRQIITQLYADGSYYDVCPAAGQQDRLGTPIDTLLTELETRYPESDWTIEILRNLLSRGLKTGIYKQSCITADNYFAYNGMAKVNSANEQYADISRRICISCGNQKQCCNK